MMGVVIVAEFSLSKATYSISQIWSVSSKQLLIVDTIVHARFYLKFNKFLGGHALRSPRRFLALSAAMNAPSFLNLPLQTRRNPGMYN